MVYSSDASSPVPSFGRLNSIGLRSSVGQGKGPKLSAARQRRLDELIDKNRDSSLSARESAELEAILDEIDRKSFWRVARALVAQRNAAISTAKRGSK